MPSYKRKYFFGRLNTIAVYENKKNFIMNGLRPGVSIESHGNGWLFAEISEIVNDLGDFIHGYLVKYSDSFEEVIHPEEGQFDETSIQDRVKAKSEFFLHIKSGLIAYHPVGKKIPRPLFDSKFRDLFEKAYDNFFVSAEIQTVEDRFEIFEQIRGLQVVEKITFRLHPSNPNNDPIWKDVDDDIHSMDAANYLEEYSSKPGSKKGLNKDLILNSDRIKGRFIMAEDGYGKGEVVGTKDGQTKNLSTGKNPTTATILLKEEPEENLNALKDTLKKIFDRFKHD